MTRQLKITVRLKHTRTSHTAGQATTTQRHAFTCTQTHTMKNLDYVCYWLISDEPEFLHACASLSTHDPTRLNFTDKICTHTCSYTHKLRLCVLLIDLRAIKFFSCRCHNTNPQQCQGLTMSNKENISWKHRLLMGNVFWGYKGDADDITSNSLFAEGVRRTTVKQTLCAAHVRNTFAKSMHTHSQLFCAN